MTITHDALDLTVQGSPALYKAPAPNPLCTGSQLPQLVTSGGQDWITVQTCSLENLNLQLSKVLTSGGWLHAVGERAVWILLECFLAIFMYTSKYRLPL